MFLEHKISKDLLGMHERKVKAIVDWPAPKLVSELRSFLGLANHYQKFFQWYCRKVAPLTDLLKKDQKWTWNVPCQEAFKEVKVALHEKEMLAAVHCL